MDQNLVTAIGAFVLSLLLIVLVVAMRKRARLRTTLFWLGVALLPAGAYLAGLIPHLVDVWNSFALWWRDISPNLAASPGLLIGVVLAGLGVLLMIISRLMPIKPKTVVTSPASSSSAGASAVRSRPLYDSTPGSQSTPADRPLP